MMPPGFQAFLIADVNAPAHNGAKVIDHAAHARTELTVEHDAALLVSNELEMVQAIGVRKGDLIQ